MTDGSSVLILPLFFCTFLGEDNLLDMATVYPPNESTGKENHAEAPIHELKDERA